MPEEPNLPAPPATPVEASNRLGALTSNKEWGAKLLAGDAATVKEFHALSKMSAARDTVDIAMSNGAIEHHLAAGGIPDSDMRVMSETAEMLRGRGIGDDVIKQALSEQEITQHEHDLVAAWKAQHMKDTAWIKSFLAGDVDAVRQMTLANITLGSPIKKAA
jgi:hypothetical protein